MLKIQKTKKETNSNGLRTYIGRSHHQNLLAWHNDLLLLKTQSRYIHSENNNTAALATSRATD